MLFSIANNDDTINDNCFHPKTCLPEYRDWIQSPPSGESIPTILKDEAKIITLMNGIVENNEFLTIMDSFKTLYDEFLGSYVHTLDFFNATIERITGQLNQVSGEEGDMFSFVNCNFIGTNLKILLKYLHEALGGNFYTIGVCLLLVGSSMALSICFTILLIIIINSSVDSNKKTP